MPHIPATEHHALSDFHAVVAGIESTYGRIVYLASLRDRGTGIYHHDLLRQAPDEDAQQAASAAHEEAFHAWLNMTTQEQLLDFQTLSEKIPIATDPWTLQTLWSSQPLDELLPSGASGAEQALFMSESLLVIALAAQEVAAR